MSPNPHAGGTRCCIAADGDGDITPGERFGSVSFEAGRGDRGLDDLQGAFARPSYVLLALAGLVLLLACVNLRTCCWRAALAGGER